MERMEFKKWVQSRIKADLLPTLRERGFRKGRAGWYIRERGGVVQFLRFSLKASQVSLSGGSSPVFFPFATLPYHGLALSGGDAMLCQNGIRVPVPVSGPPLVTPEAAEKWDRLAALIRERLLPELDQIHSLEELMSFPFLVPDNDNWNVLRWYVQGVYRCLSGDIPGGLSLLERARGCKRGYLDYLESIDCSFSPKDDQTAAIFDSIDLLLAAGEEGFSSAFVQICGEARAWYKV